MFTDFITTSKPVLNFSHGVNTILLNLGESLKLFPYEAVDVIVEVFRERSIYISAMIELKNKIEKEICLDINKPTEKQKYHEYIKNKYKSYDSKVWAAPEIEEAKLNEREKKRINRKKSFMDGKNYGQIRQSLEISQDKIFSFALKISGYAIVLLGVSVLGSSVGIVLTMHGMVLLISGVALVVFGHDLAVIGTHLRNGADSEEKDKKFLRGWAIVQTAVGLVPHYEYPVEDLKKGMEPILLKTYLVPIILQNIYGIKAVLER